jgi:hypothetical protein
MATNGNNGNPFGDTSWVNQDYAEMVLPPTVQWRRGDLTNQNPLLKSGCWQLTVENFQPIIGDSLEAVDVLHSGGVVVPSYLLGQIHIAVLAYRKRWYVADAEGNVTWLKQGDQFPPGAKSKLQVWALCKELNAEPVIVSVSGMNAKHLQDAMQDFVRKVITPASRLAKTRFGRHHFWLPLATQGRLAVKNNQYVTPPGLALRDSNPETLRALFTGKEIAGYAESVIPEAQEWAKGVADQQPGQQAPDFDHAPEPDESYAPVEEDQIPF